MICDDCKCRDKCNKIISESATYCPDRSWHSADTSKTVKKMLTKVWQSYGMYSTTMLGNMSAWREVCYGSVDTSEGLNHDMR